MCSNYVQRISKHLDALNGHERDLDELLLSEMTVHLCVNQNGNAKPSRNAQLKFIFRNLSSSGGTG